MHAILIAATADSIPLFPCLPPDLLIDCWTLWSVKTQNTIAQLGSDRIITFFNDEGGKFAAGGVFASGRVYIFYTN